MISCRDPSIKHDYTNEIVSNRRSLLFLSCSRDVIDYSIAFIHTHRRAKCICYIMFVWQEVRAERLLSYWYAAAAIVYATMSVSDRIDILFNRTHIIMKKRRRINANLVLLSNTWLDPPRSDLFRVLVFRFRAKLGINVPVGFVMITFVCCDQTLCGWG